MEQAKAVAASWARSFLAAALALLGDYLQERTNAEHLHLQDGGGVVEV